MSNNNRKLNEKDTGEFLSRLSDLADSTTDLSGGLRAAAQETNSLQLRRMMNGMADRVESGMSVDEAIKESANGLPAFVSGVVRIGLETGNLRKMMMEFVAEHQRAREIWRHVKFSLAYPLLLIAMSCAVCIFLMLVAAPIIKATIEEFEIELSSQIVYSTSFITWFAESGAAHLGMSIVVMALLLLIATVFGGRRFLFQFFATMPALGKLIQWQAFAEFTRLLQMTIEQNVPLPKALHLVSHGVRNPFVAFLARSMSVRAETGLSLAATVEQTPHIPGIVIAAIRWGEESGDLTAALETLHEMLYSAIRVRSELLSRILPPMILVLVAGLVITIAATMILPLTSLIQNLS